nr:immunoglobulin heavy chain junction region [Macaca mulatta]MOW82888.1 immunoglobulin heavy chain junction region [Macaca mulatta]
CARGELVGWIYFDYW